MLMAEFCSVAFVLGVCQPSTHLCFCFYPDIRAPAIHKTCEREHVKAGCLALKRAF